jgi:hypothetical protein
VPVHDPITVTLRQGRFALLHKARMSPCSVTITASSNPEQGGVQFRTRTFAFRFTNVFTAEKVSLGLFATLPSATIEAKTPEGVSTLDITYVIKTGADAD